MWKLRRHRHEPRNDWAEVTTNVRAKSTHISTEEPLTSQEFLRKQPAHMECQGVAYTVGRPPSCYSFGRDDILIMNALTYCTLQKFALFTIRAWILYLSKFPHWRKPQGETYVRHDLTSCDLAEHCIWCVQPWIWMSLMRPEWMSSDAQAKASPVPCSRTPWERGHWYFRTATEGNDWNLYVVIITAEFSKLTRVISSQN